MPSVPNLVFILSTASTIRLDVFGPIPTGIQELSSHWTDLPEGCWAALDHPR